MSNGPALFSDIGKRARDLLTKDYNFHQKFTLSMTSGAGLVVVVLFPIVVFLIFYQRRRDAYDLHHAILGLLFSIVLSAIVTDVLKDAVGRPRPHFFWRCFPDGSEGLTANGMKVDQVFTGDIISQYKSGNTIVDVKLDTKSNVATTVTVNELVPGMKAMLSFKIPDDKSGKLDLQHLHKQAALNASIGLAPVPLLEFAAAIGSKELSLGAEVGFDATTAAITKYNVGIGFNQHDFSASLLLVDKGQNLKVSYMHVVNPKTGDSVAAEMTHRLNTMDNCFTIGSFHAITPFTMVKTRFNNHGKIGVLCQKEWRPKSLVTLSAEYDPKSVTSPSKLGLALALK